MPTLLAMSPQKAPCTWSLAVTYTGPAAEMFQAGSESEGQPGGTMRMVNEQSITVTQKH